MAAKNYIKVALVTLLTLAIVICATPFAFATESDTVAADTDAGIELVDAETADHDHVETDVAAPAETGEDTSADAEESGDVTTAADESSDSDKEEKKGISVGTIVSIAIVALIVIFGAVYCIKNKEKVAKFIREVKSECKKIVWTPWKTVRKNLLIVLVVIVVFAIVIGALDLLFHKGIIALGDLI